MIEETGLPSETGNENNPSIVVGKKSASIFLYIKSMSLLLLTLLPFLGAFIFNPGKDSFEKYAINRVCTIKFDGLDWSYIRSERTNYGIFSTFKAVYLHPCDETKKTRTYVGICGIFINISFGGLKELRVKRVFRHGKYSVNP